MPLPVTSGAAAVMAVMEPREARHSGYPRLWRQHLWVRDSTDGPWQRRRRLHRRLCHAAGAGGGAIRLTVTGVLQVDGRISARGNPGSSSERGRRVRRQYLSDGRDAGRFGSDLRQRRGGQLPRRRRRRRTHRHHLYAANVFSGLMSAYGGGGYASGGAGTIYTKANNQSTGLVTLDNGGQAGTNTSWATSSGTVDLTVQRRGSALRPRTPLRQTIGTLLVASNGWLVLASSPGYSAPMLTVDWQRHRPGWRRHHRRRHRFTREAQGTGAGKYVRSGIRLCQQRRRSRRLWGRPAAESSRRAGGSYLWLADGTDQPGQRRRNLLYLSRRVVLAAADIRLNVTGTLQVDGRISAGGHGRGQRECRRRVGRQHYR